MGPDAEGDPFLVSGRSGAPSLEDLVADFIMKREEGGNPSLDEYLARYPKHAEQLAKLLAWDTVPPPTKKEVGATTGRPTGATAAESRALREDPDVLIIGPYRVEQHVSTAGGGTVYRARRPDIDQVVALKVLDMRGAVDPRDLQRFQREAAMLRKLDLVNVVPVLDAGEDHGRFWIAMKWVEGETVARLRESAKDPAHRLHDLRERGRFVARLARTFTAIHGFGILHRDVKPSNIMVDRTGEPMIIDFGIAQASALPELTVSSDQAMGTPRYLAPELLEGGNERVSPQTDVYGLGLCLYELCTGTEAFTQRTRADLFTRIRTAGPLPPRGLNREIPPELAAVILRAIEIHPARRYPDMASFAGDLERVARGEPPDPLTLRRANPLARFVHRHRRGVIVSAALLVVIVALSGWIWTETIAPRLRASELERELAPYAWFAPEAFPEGLGLPSLADAQELAKGPAATLEQRLLAAWISWCTGRPRDALASLPAERADDGFGIRVLRRIWQAMRDRAGRATHTEQQVSFPDAADPDRLALVPLDSGDEALEPQLIDLAIREATAAGAPTTPEDHLIAALLEWNTVPNDPSEPSRLRREGIRARLTHAVNGRTEAPARYLRAMLEFTEGQDDQAREDLAFVVAQRPQAVGARYLLGILEARAGHAAVAADLLGEVFRLTPGNHRARNRIAAHYALALASLGRVDEAVALLKLWWVSASDRWQDHVIPRVLAAEIQRRAGHLELAKALLLDAVRKEEQMKLEEKRRTEDKDAPGTVAPIVVWEPAVRELLLVLDALKDAPAAAEIRARMKRSDVFLCPLPRTAENYLDLDLGGLRRLDANRTFRPAPVIPAPPKDG